MSYTAYNVFLNITMLSDNSIYFYYMLNAYPGYDYPPLIYDRNFTKFAILNKTWTLNDVLTINENPFYFEIH